MQRLPLLINIESNSICLISEGTREHGCKNTQCRNLLVAASHMGSCPYGGEAAMPCPSPTVYVLTPDTPSDISDSAFRSLCAFEAGTAMVSRVAQLHVQILSVAFAAGAVGGIEAPIHLAKSFYEMCWWSGRRSCATCRLGELSDCSSVRGSAHHLGAWSKHCSRSQQGRPLPEACMGRRIRPSLPHTSTEIH